MLVQVLTLLLVSYSEFEASSAAHQERDSSPPIIRLNEFASALLSQPIISRLALVSIPSAFPLQPAKPLSTLSTGATSKKGQSSWIFLETVTEISLILI